MLRKIHELFLFPLAEHGKVMIQLIAVHCQFVSAQHLCTSFPQLHSLPKSLSNVLIAFPPLRICRPSVWFQLLCAPGLRLNP
nr:MAG TPA: hypothetical protein [Caudoviricetes sp.]